MAKAKVIVKTHEGKIVNGEIVLGEVVRTTDMETPDKLETADDFVRVAKELAERNATIKKMFLNLPMQKERILDHPGEDFRIRQYYLVTGESNIETITT